MYIIKAVLLAMKRKQYGLYHTTNMFLKMG